MTKEQIAEHHATLRMACDPKSPFFGTINFENGLLSLPIPEQQEVFDTMPSDLRAIVEGFKDNR